MQLEVQNSAQNRYLIRTLSHRVRGSLFFNLGTAFFSFLPQSFIFLTFYFILEYSQLTML